MRFFSILCLLLCGVTSVVHARPLTKHVVLISVDGLRPEFYLDERWPAPMMQQMRMNGAHAEAVTGVFPTVTYPSHTTMITGVLPIRHGVLYNSPFERGGSTGRWYWEEGDVRVPTLWDAVRAADGTTASLGWPVSVGAPIDHNLPEIWSLESDVDPITVMREHATPGLFEEVEREATGRLTRENFTISAMTRDDRAGDIAAYWLTTHKPTLMTVHLIETDHFQHEDGRDSAQVRRAVAAVDRAIAQMWEAAEAVGMLDRTTFVITGDHGHVDLHTQLAPNVWLAEAGLVPATAQDAETGRGDWRAVFHTTGASAFLHLRDTDDREAVDRARAALEALPAGVRDLFRIIERAELDTLGAAPEAAFALDLAPGIHVTGSTRGPAIRPADGATHGYLPSTPGMATGFVASGAGIRQGAVAARIRLTDVAPFVARLLDLQLDATDGVAPLGFLDTKVSE